MKEYIADNKVTVFYLLFAITLLATSVGLWYMENPKTSHTITFGNNPIQLEDRKSIDVYNQSEYTTTQYSILQNHLTKKLRVYTDTDAKLATIERPPRYDDTKEKWSLMQNLSRHDAVQIGESYYPINYTHERTNSYMTFEIYFTGWAGSMVLIILGAAGFSRANR